MRLSTVQIMVVSLVVGWAVSTTSIVWSFSANWAKTQQQVKANHKTLEDHETRIRNIEESTFQVERDVSWVRQTMELFDKLRNSQ